ncbi:putative mitochondrial protein, partial [Mucuna pruriens]
MKELGHLTYFLGLDLYYHPEDIFLDQQKYIQDLIHLVGLTNFTPVDTPLEVNVKYRQREGNILDDPTLYHKLVGSLIYVTISHPDILFVVHIYNESLDISLTPQTYSNVDWANYPNTTKSIIDPCMFLGNALISWKYSISKSSTKSLDSLKHNQLRCMFTTLFTMNKRNTSKLIVTRYEKSMIVESSVYHMSQHLFKQLIFSLKDGKGSETSLHGYELIDINEFGIHSESETHTDFENQKDKYHG